MALGQISSTFECIDKFGNTTNFYKANAGDTTKIKFNIAESIFFATDDTLTIRSNSVLTTQKKLVFPNYASMNGFAVGQTVVLTKTTNGGVITTRTTTIVSIDYDLLQIEFALLLASGNLNLYDSNNTMIIYSTSLRTDLYLNLGFIKSSAPNLINQIASTSQGAYIGATNSLRKSLIDSSKVSLKATNAGGLAVAGSMSFTQIGLKSGSFEIKNTLITRNANVNVYLRSFSVEFDIIQLGALVPDAFTSADSTFIRLYNDLEWYSSTDLNNPTVTINTHQSSQTGYFGSPFLIDTFNSTFTSSTGDELNVSTAVTRTAVFASASSVIAMGSLYVPQDDTYYKNNQYDQSVLCMLIEQTGALAVGIYTSKTSPTGANYTIEILTKTYVAGIHTVTYKFTPNGAFTTFMQGRSADDREVHIWFKVGNINHLVYSASLIDTPILTEDLVTFLSTPTVFKLDKSTDTYTADSLSTGAICSSRDNLIFELKGMFPNGLVYKNVTFQVICAEIANLTNFFVLENYFFDLSQVARLSNGALVTFTQLQAVNNNSINTPNSSNVVVTRKSFFPDTLTDFSLSLIYPLLINWRSWQEQLNAFALFDEERTNEWINYDTATYKIYVKATIATASKNLIMHAPIKKIYDYNEIHTDTNEEWNGTVAIAYSIESTAEATTSLIDGEIMRVKITVNNIYPATISTAWGQLGVEPKESSPRYICSTNYADDTNQNNPFLPITGETKLKQTIVSPTQSTYEMLIDTNLMSGTDYTFDFKFYNDVAINEQVRSVFDVKINSLIAPIDYTLQDDEDCCDSTFDVFAETVLVKSQNNDVNSFWQILLGGSYSLFFEVYKNDVLIETLTSITFPKQANAKYATVAWRAILLEHGAGCYVVKSRNSDFTTSIYNVLGTYNLQEWSYDGVLGKVRIQSIFNTNQSIDGINFTGANVFDTLNINGFFGKIDPKMESRNNGNSARLSVKVVRESLNTYELTTNPITRTFSRKLLNLFLISETNTYITDYNTFNHEIYSSKRVIVSESPTVEHFDFSNKIKIICKFEDKTKNQRSFH